MILPATFCVVLSTTFLTSFETFLTSVVWPEVVAVVDSDASATDVVPSDAVDGIADRFVGVAAEFAMSTVIAKAMQIKISQRKNAIFSLFFFSKTLLSGSLKHSITLIHKLFLEKLLVKHLRMMFAVCMFGSGGGSLQLQLGIED